MKSDLFTHYLECFRQAGRYRKKRYFVECRILGVLTNGKVVIECISQKGNSIGDMTTRYVSSDKLIKIYEQTQ